MIRFFAALLALTFTTAAALKIAVVQAEADPKKKARAFPPIPLERTRATGLRRLDGTISMARATPCRRSLSGLGYKTMATGRLRKPLAVF